MALYRSNINPDSKPSISATGRDNVVRTTYIIKYENLNQDFNKILKKFSYPETSNFPKFKIKNDSVKQTLQTIEIIQEMFSEEISYFNYKPPKLNF